LAERTGKIIKALMEKAHTYISLLEYRNMSADGLKSLTQLLISRRLHSILPSTSKRLKPEVVHQSAIRNQRHLCQKRQKPYFDRIALTLPALWTSNIKK
uniref:Uncharacterized protein n=1 Tax=Fundulus heteroclitus TaxID=8078 RepID=A0A3Q2PHF9_FUNHE